MCSKILTYSIFLYLITFKVCNAATQNNGYCSFTPEGREIVQKWMCDRELDPYFKKENVTVACESLEAVESVTILMKIPAHVWSRHRRRFFNDSARQIVTNTALGIYGGAMLGLIGKGCVTSECSWFDRIIAAGVGASTMGLFSFICTRDYVLKKAEMVRLSDTLEQSPGASDTVVLNLKGLVAHIKSQPSTGTIKLAITDRDDEHGLVYAIKSKQAP